MQSVTAEDRNNVGLTVYFQKFSNGTRVLRVFAPLGILLPVIGFTIAAIAFTQRSRTLIHAPSRHPAPVPAYEAQDA